MSLSLSRSIHEFVIKQAEFERISRSQWVEGILEQIKKDFEVDHPDAEQLMAEAEYREER